MKKIISSFDLNYYCYSIFRSIVAFQLLLTIIFNDFNIIFIENKINLPYSLTVDLITFKVLSIIILIATISGILPRITGLLHFAITFIFFKSCACIDGGDQLATNLSFLIVPLSTLDRNNNHWNNSRGMFKSEFGKSFYFFVYWLICIQIAIVYLHSSIGKLSVDEWKDGTALWYWITHESFGSSYFILKFFKWILSYPWIVYSLNWFVIILELLIALMLFVPKNQLLPKYISYLGIVLHICVILIHGILTFSLVMIGSLIFYFQIDLFNLWKSRYIRQ